MFVAFGHKVCYRYDKIKVLFKKFGVVCQRLKISRIVFNIFILLSSHFKIMFPVFLFLLVSLWVYNRKNNSKFFQFIRVFSVARRKLLIKSEV